MCTYCLPFCGLFSSILLMASFDLQNILILIKSKLSIFSFIAYALLSYSRIHCQIHCLKAFHLCFLLKVFFFLLCLKLSYYIFFIFIYLFILAVLGLYRCMRAFSSCGKWGLLFVTVLRLLTAVVSLAAEHRP